MFNVVWSYWDWVALTYIKPYHDEITAVSTLIIGIFTIVLAFVAYRQIRDTRILQRAYVSVRPAGIHMYRNRNVAVAHVEICNAGNLPATKVKWFIKHTLCSDGDWKIDNIETCLVYGSGNIIAPHAKIRQGGDPIAVGQDALRVEEGLYLYVWGAVTYNNGFIWRKRTTTFCHRYHCVNFSHNPQWGFMAMGGITARDHHYGNSAN